MRSLALAIKRRCKIITALAIAFTAVLISLGYILLRLVPMTLFALGFFIGFIMWLANREHQPFSSFRLPFYVTPGLFILHKIEERYLDSFPELSKITGVPMPDTGSIYVLILYLFAAAWLLIPILTSREVEFGYFFAWTFFASMGVVEVAHFAFPLFTGKNYGYFPGMASATLLVPAAWWGIVRLRSSKFKSQMT